jgi:formylglycine-generating enzyme required for sulfatase activity
MRRAALLCVATLGATAFACDAILGIDDHGVESEAGAHDAGGTVSTSGDASSSSSGGQAGGMDAMTADAMSAEAMAGDTTAPDVVTQEATTLDAGSDAHDATADTGVQPILEGGGCDGPCTVGGPTMVPVTTFYVDSTEVTVAQYAQFLAAKGSDTSGQPSACAWNTSFMPAGTNSGTFPITGVDWCDAFAFCNWAGKHLCGAIGDGGAIASSNVLKQNVSQWFLACGGPGGSSDPNGHPMCNATFGTSGLVAVASLPGCEGWYTGLFDLEGNASEWVDSCDVDAGAAGGASDTCYVLGGSYLDETAYCTESNGLARNTRVDSIGFRCCHE